jgi:hypothetical protein
MLEVVHHLGRIHSLILPLCNFMSFVVKK